MGRKPNALILEFFERGAKLADQSNRYEHSCKRCGEVVSEHARVLCMLLLTKTKPVSQRKTRQFDTPFV